jgi:hypothetical protein
MWDETSGKESFCLAALACRASLIATAEAQPARASRDPDARLVSRRELEHDKAPIKGLTQCGDCRQGMQPNPNAIDWIEATLKRYGYPTERLKHELGQLSRTSCEPSLEMASPATAREGEHPLAIRGRAIAATSLGGTASPCASPR